MLTLFKGIKDRESLFYHLKVLNYLKKKSFYEHTSFGEKMIKFKFFSLNSMNHLIVNGVDKKALFN